MPSAIHPDPAPPGPAPAGGAARPARPDRYGGFRPEIQGLRALAVLLVVVYHVFLGRVSGGVDIFLLISAFFLTLSFTRKLDSGRPLALGRYWLHAFKRLLPLAALTILGTLLLVELVHPEDEAAQWYPHALASVLYVENWRLGFSAVDYYAADHSTASPFQHFWSLSVQGQVFLLWPLIFGGTWLLTRSGRWRPVPVLAVAFGAIFAASLAWSVHVTATNQAFAYFDTRARLWEFALGSLLALALPYLNPSRRARVVLGWAGLVSMVSVGVLVDVQGAFPGWIALWPLASAAAIVVAGRTGSRAGLDRILTSRPLVRLGDASYALYLIHWPLLITYLVLRDRPMAGPRSGVVLIVLSVVLALIATAAVEKPFHRWSWAEATRPRLAMVIGTCVALVATPVLAQQQAEERRAALIEAAAWANNPGARSLLPQFENAGDPDAPTIPVSLAGDYRKPDLGRQCDRGYGLGAGQVEWCHETLPAENPAKTLLLLGNSHVLQWVPAAVELAEEHGWRVVSYIRGNCLLATVEEQVAEQEACATWLDGVQDVVDTVDPDMVLVQGTRTEPGVETFLPGVEQRIRDLAAQDIQVIGIRDNPRFEEPTSHCAAESGADDPGCAPTHPALGTVSPLQPVADELARVSTFEMNDVICPAQRCTPVVGNVYTYWDTNHVSPEYVRSASGIFAQRFEEALAADGVTM
jgi:peptidoglycan/LPS O-acetylase OafA/YrhL